MEDTLRKYCQHYIPEEMCPYIKSGIFAILVVSGTAFLFSLFNRLRMRGKVKRAMKEAYNKRAEQLKSLKEKLQKSSLTKEMRNKILSLDIVQLQKRLKDRSLKAIDVLHAYQYKALEAQEKTNCLTAIIPEAEELALKCDSVPYVTKPLHGIPISLKENIIYKGLHTTCGLGFSLLSPPHADDSNLVKCLKELGAVPFVTTNVPQSLMSISCDNSIFGQTRNPHKADRCPGGSSGGEAALIGYGGSILGIGSDIGGSIRCPAHFCGIYGLKTTITRMGLGSAYKPVKEQILIQTSVGPMAQTADGLIMATKALFSQEVFEMDPQISPTEFQNHLFDGKRKLRIGYYETDNVVSATSACRRAVLLAKKALEAKGHTVIDFTPPRILDAVLLAVNITCSDGYLMSKLIKYESPTEELYFITKSEGFRKIISALVYPFDKISSKIVRALDGRRKYQDIYNLVAEKEKYDKEFADAMKKDKLDALICPVMSSTSLLIKCPNFGRFPNYSLPYNLLNYPGVSMPITKVTEEDVKATYKARSLTEYLVKKSIPGSVGLPVSIQIIVPTYKDELALRIMKELDSELKKKSG
ncbi:fatty-acid amide hydrolase 1 [Octopus bimaculoides]|uniref:fatty acid amide hydrolase n=1 Tax=Octopus bimaculoides TaxID=37653 RepID=A0A0L8I129_OCTBM|nr:fatty-acid amide hydrolase 1 [Octopus bimaculoides]XP_052825236.1 fatty-acid amide hydrolase 1 [Octopus bimaculoides]XP_052825237.1 fatty-acid amide hydrolase 1 [Octopus bimaculoides]XP_052825238.1 fatty-acid amide hydrolase 1 [Octopus bimaculoides]|eukprot:XP_014767730.1 PREDICTED: fatty-acid amide hydrolase 1-like [Octopus bimaculoides]